MMLSPDEVEHGSGHFKTPFFMEEWGFSLVWRFDDRYRKGKRNEMPEEEFLSNIPCYRFRYIISGKYLTDFPYVML